MSNSRRAGLLAAACSLGLMAGFVSAAQAETLADAIALAYQTNPTLQQQRASPRAADEGVVQAKTAFRPQASLAADVSQSRSDPYSGASVDSKGSGASVSITQSLYTGGKASANLTAAEADVLSA
ncbi:MAG: TolC family protein, partial [bacterium]|nr:TolC family protein [bacterium]